MLSELYYLIIEHSTKILAAEIGSHMFYTDNIFKSFIICFLFSIFSSTFYKRNYSFSAKRNISYTSICVEQI